MVTPEVPTYLEEIAVAHSLRVLKQRIRDAGEVRLEQMEPPEVFAGTGEVAWGIRKWFTRGVLDLKTAAAAEVAEELLGSQQWLSEGGMSIASFVLPSERPPEEMPRYAGETFTAAEEFRVAVARHTGTYWGSALPKVPPAKEGVRALLRR